MMESLLSWIHSVRQNGYLGLLTLFIVCIQCHEMIRNFEVARRLATKTPYFSQEEPRNAPAPNDCKPIQLNMVIRHGTRYPTKKVIRKIEDLLKRMKERSPLGDLPVWLLEWDIEKYYPLSQEALLAQAGTEELIGLGKRIRSKYGHSFKKYYAKTSYTFEHTYKVRTKQSASA
jgi:multiple inositol-polyphosphate phosphatase/2,3-bisphosphoglycerate 3-phosphatase